MKKYTLQLCYALYNRPHSDEEKINENQQIAKRMRKESFFSFRQEPSFPGKSRKVFDFVQSDFVAEFRIFQLSRFYFSSDQVSSQSPKTDSMGIKR